MQEAADRAVTQVITEVVQQGRTVYPLQTVAFALKEQYGARISQAGIDRTVELIQEIRAQSQAPAPQATPPTAPDTAASDSVIPDTAGGQG